MIEIDLRGDKWQKWKRVFLTCPCHEINRDEAAGLKSCKNTLKITIFVKMWNLGQYRENWYFVNKCLIKGVLHLWALFLKTLCIFSQNKATSDKVFYGSGQKCSKELKNHSFTSVETIVVKLQWKMCENQYFPCFEPQINNHWSLWNSKAIIRFPEMLPIRNIYLTCYQCVVVFEKNTKTVQKLAWGAVPP